MTSRIKVWNWHLCQRIILMRSLCVLSMKFVCFADLDLQKFYMQIIAATYWHVVFFTPMAVDQELYEVITYNLAHKLISVLWFQICSQIFKIWSLWRHITENVHFASNCRTYDIIMTSGTKVWNWHLCQRLILMRSLWCAKYEVCMFYRSWLTEVL